MNNDNQLANWLAENTLKGVIFDFDGTLLDIRDPLERSVKEVFKEHKIDFDIDESIKEIGSVLESVQGFPLSRIILESHDIFQFITTLEKVPFLKKLRIATEIFAKYMEYEKEAELFSEAYLLIEQLSKRYDLYIVSHNQTKNLKEHLKRKNIGRFFKDTLGADELPELKPSPLALQPVLSRYSPLKGNEFLMVGDMPTDIEAGREAGIWTVAIASGISNKDLLNNYMPDLLIDSLTQLLDLFGIEYNNKAITNAKKSVKIY